MFWKFFGNDDKEDEEQIEAKRDNYIELPPLEDLETWVLNLVVKLKLTPGEFTFLPAYGGILLFVKDEGISWLPYSQIKEALGEIDKGKLVENTATLGGVAAVAATGAHLLPALLVHRIIKGSYRIIAKPAPKDSMNFLNSMIDKVIIEETKIKESLLNTFEEVPYKKGDRRTFSTYVISIRRRLLDKDDPNAAMKLLQGIKTFIVGSKEPIFAIPPQSDVQQFATILEKHGLNVEWKKVDNVLEDGEGNYIIQDDPSENQ